MLKAMLIKEFLLVLRDKHSVAALFIMPAIFIMIMSAALADTFDGDRALMTYVVVDRDGSTPMTSLRSVLAENPFFEESERDITGTDYRHVLLDRTVQFVLVIPEVFTENLAEDTIPEALTELYVAADVKQEMVKLFESQLTLAVLERRLEIMGEELRGFFPLATDRLEALQFDPEKVTTVRYAALEGDRTPTSTQQSVPSWIVFAMFFVIIPMSTIFITERNEHTLARMRAMNVSIPILFAGKIAPYFVINQIQTWVMILVGMYVVPLLGADALTLGNSVTGLILVSLGVSLAAIGTTVLISVSVRTVTQATTIGGILNILLGAVGGIMVPKFVMPPAMQRLSWISPMSWGLEGFLDIFLRGLGIAAVIPTVAALAGFGIVLLLVAGTVFSYKTGI